MIIKRSRRICIPACVMSCYVALPFILLTLSKSAQQIVNRLSSKVRSIEDPVIRAMALARVYGAEYFCTRSSMVIGMKRIADITASIA